MSKINVAIVDDHEVVINGLRAMLLGAPDITVTFSTTNADVLLNKLPEILVDVLLLDIQMPVIDGLEVCKLITRSFPGIRIVAFSSFDDTHYIRKIMRNGAVGYLLKNTSRETILTAISTVMTGEQFIDETMQKMLIHEGITGQRRSIYEIPLTKREKEILKMVAEESSNQEIADKLFISLRTVESHRANLNQKLGAKNTVSLVLEAIKRGLIEG